MTNSTFICIACSNSIYNFIYISSIRLQHLYLTQLIYTNMHLRKLIFSVIIENRSNNYFTSCNSNDFGGKSASDLNLIFVSFLSKSSELIYVDLTKFLILLHISLLFFNVTFYSSVRISVKYLSPLLSSICSLDMLIIRYKGFKVAKNNIFCMNFFPS